MQIKKVTAKTLENMLKGELSFNDNNLVSKSHLDSTLILTLDNKKLFIAYELNNSKLMPISIKMVALFKNGNEENNVSLFEKSKSYFVSEIFTLIKNNKMVNKNGKTS